MNFKKLMRASTVLGVSLAMAACSGGGSTSGGDSGSSGGKKVTVWCWDENFNIKAMEDAKQIYMKDNPDVEIV
ncbi:MAG: ABC transporter substrate-binding protein, partial [Ileibacterium sp.]|nr:ABC transporter substrate-binding protein [Ileibacterium sp.]